MWIRKYEKYKQKTDKKFRKARTMLGGKKEGRKEEMKEGRGRKEERETKLSSNRSGGIQYYNTACNVRTILRTNTTDKIENEYEIGVYLIQSNNEIANR